jgi:hypothetical protein
MMIRACFQFLACWYLDSDRDVPAWLQCRIDADPALRQSLEHLHRLERDLRFAARSELERFRDDRNAVPTSVRLRDATPSQPVLRIGRFSQRGGHRAFPFAMAASLAILAGAGVWLMTASQRSTPSFVAKAPEAPNGTNAAAVSSEKVPATSEAAAPSARKPSPLIAAKRWLDRALQPDSETPSQALSNASSHGNSNAQVAALRLESAWREQLASVKAGVRDGTRYFAVRLPVTGMRLLLPSDR